MIQSAPDQQAIKRNRFTTLAIMMLPLLVMGAATGLWLAVSSGKLDIVGSLGTHNKGTLIDPVREINSVVLLKPGGEPFDYLQSTPMWSILIPGGAGCDDACRDTLWLTRQLHTALGSRAAHLRRFYLSTSWPLEPELADYLATEHPGLEVLHGSPAAVEQLLGSLPDGRQPLTDKLYYLIDKHGFVMMVYGPEHSGKEVITDLKFLMKQTGDN